MWCNEDLEVKRKLCYYKEINNPNLEDQNYLSILTSSFFFAKIRTNSHELHNETGRWTTPKVQWDESIFHLCESTSVEDEITLS